MASDSDGDGAGDVLWRHEGSGSNALWLDGEYARQKPVPAVINPDWQAVAVGAATGTALRTSPTARRAGANAVWQAWTLLFLSAEV